MCNSLFLEESEERRKCFLNVRLMFAKIRGIFEMNLKSATTRLYDTEAKIICIVSKKGAQCIECHHKDI